MNIAFMIAYLRYEMRYLIEKCGVCLGKCLFEFNEMSGEINAFYFYGYLTYFPIQSPHSMDPSVTSSNQNWHQKITQKRVSPSSSPNNLPLSPARAWLINLQPHSPHPHYIHGERWTTPGHCTSHPSSQTKSILLHQSKRNVFLWLQ